MGDQRLIPINRNLQEKELTMLDNSDFFPAKVASFPHVSKLFCDLLEGNTVVEVLNYGTDPTDTSSTGDEELERHFWVAVVVEIKGYYILLRYLSDNMGKDSSQDFWIHSLSANVQSIGYSYRKRIPWRKPSHCIVSTDSIDTFLYSHILNAYTIPWNLHTKVRKLLTTATSERLLLNPRANKIHFTIGNKIEVRCAQKIDTFFVGEVTEIIGTRIQVQYTRFEIGTGVSTPTILWCDKDSEIIQPCGWCKTVGYRKIIAHQTYDPKLLDTSGSDYENYDYGDLKVGQKLEVIDPLIRSLLHVATVTAILSFGYVVVRSELQENEEATPFCVHISSREIFRFGFADRNKVPIATPFESQKIQRPRQQKKTNSTQVSNKLLNPNKYETENYDAVTFEKYMKLEASDWCNPGLIRPATIIDVIKDGRNELLNIRYNGHHSYDQWVASSSCEIYPVGYSELILHRLEPGEETDSDTETDDAECECLYERIIRGEISQNYYNRLSCTAMAASFICYMSTSTHPDSITPAIINKILLHGHKIYVSVRERIGPTPANRMLTAFHLNGPLKFGNKNCLFTVDEEDSWTGFLDGDKIWDRLDESLHRHKFSFAIERFLQSDIDCGILTTHCGGLSMALVKHHEFLYFFDSHARDETGGINRLSRSKDVEKVGKACVLLFASNDSSDCARRLSEHLEHNLELTRGEFSLNPVTFPPFANAN